MWIGECGNIFTALKILLCLCLKQSKNNFFLQSDEIRFWKIGGVGVEMLGLT